MTIWESISIIIVELDPNYLRYLMVKSIVSSLSYNNTQQSIIDYYYIRLFLTE